MECFKKVCESCKCAAVFSAHFIAGKVHELCQSCLHHFKRAVAQPVLTSLALTMSVAGCLGHSEPHAPEGSTISPTQGFVAATTPPPSGSFGVNNSL
jgi:hypothetical protein